MYVLGTEYDLTVEQGIQNHTVQVHVKKFKNDSPIVLRKVRRRNLHSRCRWMVVYEARRNICCFIYSAEAEARTLQRTEQIIHCHRDHHSVYGH